VKIFVTATPQARAQRRTLEFRRAGLTVDESDILADILRRDARDTGRASSPLRQADDAHLLDTTNLDIEAAFAAAVAIVENMRAAARAR
jgi:cytidylate kinase